MRRSTVISLVPIVAAGAAVRLWSIGFGLPHTQARPDETFIIAVSLDFLRGNWWPRFYAYPRLFNVGVTILYLLYGACGAVAGRFHSLADLVASWPVRWAPFFVLPRLLSALCGTATIPAVFAATRKVGGRTAGLAAALLLAFAFLHARDSHFATTDVAFTLLAVVCIWQLLSTEPGRMGRADILAAVAAGGATGTKYSAAILLLPLLVSQIWHAAAAPSRRVAAFADRRLLWMAVAFAVGLVAGVPFVIFDFKSFWTAMQAMGPDVAGGHLWRPDDTNGWWYHLRVSLRYAAGLPVLLAGVASLVITPRLDVRKASLLLAFPLAYFAVAGGVGDRPMRYVVPLVPFLCIGAGLAVDWLASRLLPSQPVAARAALAMALAAAAIAPSAWRLVQFDRLLGHRDSRVLAAEWVLQHAHPQATVAYSGSIHGDVQFAGNANVLGWRWNGALGAFLRDGQPTAGPPDWLLVQESPLPSSTQPLVTEWLRQGYQLDTVVHAFDPDGTRRTYDLADAFFLPVDGFAGIERPGPNYRIYRRVTAP
jgi:hypothetical protein